MSALLGQRFGPVIKVLGYFSTTSGNVTDDVILQYLEYHSKRDATGASRSWFTAQAVQNWLGAVGSKTVYIEADSPWENGYAESFNARLRDELLNGDVFYTLKEAQIIIEKWRKHYNAERPHSALGYRPPAPESIVLDQAPSCTNIKHGPTRGG